MSNSSRKVFLKVVLFTFVSAALSMAFSKAAGENAFPNTTLNRMQAWLNSSYVNIEQKRSIVIKSQTKLNVRTRSIDVVFFQAESDTLEISVKGLAKAGTKLEVTDALGEVRVTLNEPEGDKVTSGITITTDSETESASLRIGLPQKKILDITLNSNTGDMIARAVKTGVLRVESDASDLNLDSIQSREIEVQTHSGDVHAERITAGKVIMNTSSGDIDIEKPSAAEVKIGSSSGDIVVKIAHFDDWTAQLSSNSGDVSADVKERFQESEKKIRFGKGKHALEVTSQSGDVTVTL